MTMNNQFDINFFLNKFSAIPDALWHVGDFVYENRYCALGHCGQLRDVMSIVQAEPQARALIELFRALNLSVAQVNDGLNHCYRQPTPKARILAALHDVKARAEAALDAYELRKLTLTPAKEQVSA